MTKPELLRLVRLLSAIESWGLSQGKMMPDYLHDDLSSALEVIEKAILLPEQPNAQVHGLVTVPCNVTLEQHKDKR